MDDNDWHKLSYASAFDFAKETIRGCLLINGAAAAGLVTFLPHAKEAGLNLHAMGNAAICFGFGTLLAVVGFGLSYIAQIYISETHPATPHQINVFKKWRYAAVAAIVSSAIAFLFGLCTALGSIPAN
jgi:hypothetical protein